MNHQEKTAEGVAAPKAVTQKAEDSIIGHEVQADKIRATLKAQFALRGHSVHELAEGGFLVCRHGHAKHCPDLSALAAFARVTGVA